MKSSSTYTALFIQGIVISSLYIYTGQGCNKKDTHLDFVKLLFFYMIVQGIGRMMNVDNSIIALTFLGKIIAAFLENSN